MFEKVTIHLNNDYYPGKTFIIQTNNDPEKNMYIQKSKLNDKPWNCCWFNHQEFANGGILELELGPKPNKKWGIIPPPTITLSE